jgi:hypothetical protein
MHRVVVDHEQLEVRADLQDDDGEPHAPEPKDDVRPRRDVPNGDTKARPERCVGEEPPDGEGDRAGEMGERHAIQGFAERLHG